MIKYLFPPGFFIVFFYLCSCYNSIAQIPKQQEAGASPEIKKVLINGDSIHYIEKGQGSPVVFVHGSLGDYRVWGAQMDTFAVHHRVIAYSRRFAYPNKQVIDDAADYSPAGHAKDLAAFIKALHLEPVHLIGHSYGAFTALSTTIDHPELVRSLILGEPPAMSLLRSTPAGDTILQNFIQKALIPAGRSFKSNDNEKAVAMFIGQVMGDSLYYSKMPTQVQAYLMTNTLELRGSTLAQDFSPSITCDDLKRVKTPVLLLEGDRSPLLFIAINDELERCLEHEEFVRFTNCSHGLQNEKPVEFNKTVLGFIDRH
jgi:pimeloyl-ACP methyl ester carboxylesterase